MAAWEPEVANGLLKKFCDSYVGSHGRAIIHSLSSRSVNEDLSGGHDLGQRQYVCHVVHDDVCNKMYPSLYIGSSIVNVMQASSRLKYQGYAIVRVNCVTGSAIEPWGSEALGSHHVAGAETVAKRQTVLTFLEQILGKDGAAMMSALEPWRWSLPSASVMPGIARCRKPQQQFKEASLIAPSW